MKTEWIYELNGWVSCTYPYLSFDGTEIPSCPSEWAIEINTLNCAYVWKDIEKKFDYGDSYYKMTVPIIEKLLAGAGYRAASIFNILFSRFP